MNDASGYDSDKKEKFLSPPTHTHSSSYSTAKEIEEINHISHFIEKLCALFGHLKFIAT